MIDTAFIQKMKHSPIHNYAVPGLSSWLIGETSEAGCVRLFECSRNHQEPIIPHSHRFDFHCVVLEGVVHNTVWTVRNASGAVAQSMEDLFMLSDLEYGGECGKYRATPKNPVLATRTTKVHAAGGSTAQYSMRANEIHSIVFAKNTKVLFFEGPKVQDISQILEPIVNGETVHTFQVMPWMFKKD